MKPQVRIIGAGFAGCEAALYLAGRGISSELIEMKPGHYSPAHRSPLFAELVCSNSFKAMRKESASGLMKEEMRILGSHLLPLADGCAVPAGGALAVDRDMFSKAVTDEVLSNPLITVVRRREESIDRSILEIIAAGPLLDGPLAADLASVTGGFLSFYDAAAPIVLAESLDMGKLVPQSRYGRGGDSDYLNSFLKKDEYEKFIDELVHARRAELHAPDRDEKVYEGCMPIEKLASRGLDAARFGPMKPVGLRDPSTGHRPWAAAQLRKENTAGTMYNLVGFQTNLAFPEQRRVFRMLPGLEEAEFVRYGVMHRNSFLDAPKCLSGDLSLRASPLSFAAGQLTGFEGYMESALSGLMAARAVECRIEGKTFKVPPEDTMTGAMMKYIRTPNSDFQPMGANMGLLPPLGVREKNKARRYGMLADRALRSISRYAENGGITE
ncbi:MAG: methylenetetrahydrofolate--tRNA-(uracil(54)-C(5))-methyltransferase (FADH(2)-oxidizing) TrmFO [Oscillospiraceae bacterium]|jgi:methylenetetrahydrofolate--tRNA-(uracil-5-)-methyltransferase